MKRKIEKEKKENFLKKKKLTESIYGTLPTELLHNIFSFLTPTKKNNILATDELKTFVQLNLVTKNWYEYFNSNDEDKESFTKEFWFNFYKTYFDLEKDTFKDQIESLSTTDIKEIFFERYQHEISIFGYFDLEIEKELGYMSQLVKKEGKYNHLYSEKNIKKMIDLFISEKSVLITSCSSHSESIWLDKTEYEYGMDPCEADIGIKATIFLKNSFSIDLDIGYTDLRYYSDDPQVERMTFEITANDKKILVFSEDYTDLSSSAVEKLCDSLEITCIRSFSIVLLFMVIKMLEHKKIGGLYPDVDKFYKLLDEIEDDFQDQEEVEDEEEEEE